MTLQYFGPVRVCSALIVLIACGCSTTNGRHYTFRTMPTELAAHHRDNVQTLDLTRLARASGDSDVIDKGDVLEVSISAGLDEKDTMTLPVRVNDQGLALIPEIGAIPLAGMHTQAAEKTIIKACIDQQLYLDPNVTVTMKRQRMNRVMVVGAVKKPDVYELPRGKSDLLAAIVAAGGLEKDAGTKVEIRNPNRNGLQRPPQIASGSDQGVLPTGHSGIGGSAFSEDAGLMASGESRGSMNSIQVDLVSATKARSGDFAVEDGGVVSIEKRDPEPLHVMGLVKKPDRYDFPIAEEVRVTDAIAMAGGTSMALADKIYVIRRVPNSNDTAVIEVSFREAKRNSHANLRLEPSDVVSVESTPGTIFYETMQIVRFNLNAAMPLVGSGFF